MQALQRLLLSGGAVDELLGYIDPNGRHRQRRAEGVQTKGFRGAEGCSSFLRRVGSDEGSKKSRLRIANIDS